METASDVLPVATAVTVEYSLPQEHEESSIQPSFKELRKLETPYPEATFIVAGDF